MKIKHKRGRPVHWGKKESAVKKVADLKDDIANLGTANLADKMGSSYMEHNKASKASKKRASAVAEQIKAFAEKHGETHRTLQIVKGEIYAVGYSERSVGDAIDIVKAQALLPKEIFNACVYQVLDTAKLVQFVEAGKVPRAYITKMLIPGKLTKYVYVKPVGEIDKEENLGEE